MAEQSRDLDYLKRIKPKVVLTDQFPFSKTLEVGQKGQLEVIVQIMSESFEFDESGNEIRMSKLKIVEAKLIGTENFRI